MRRWEPLLLGIAAGAVFFSAVEASSQQLGSSRASGWQIAQAKGTSKSGGESKAASASSDLGQRVRQLEEQFLDIQVQLGTLESLARNAGGASPSMRSAPVGSGADTARIDALETQVRALTAQIEQLSEQIRALGAAPVTRSVEPQARSSSSLSGAPGANNEPNLDFSATVIPSGESSSDPIGQILREDLPQSGGSTIALAAPGLAGGDPKQEYETAYGYLLQQNYAAAEKAFEDFLTRYPDHPLAGNAQYWLGEAFYVRGQYKAAASAFLKGYQNYGNSAKAPDSLLKLAMSLDRLGQKEAACSSFNELSAKFPNAPSHVKTRAATERQRVGC
ncbi:MAG: tol-pal system protein YbgF [Proteobacteria bacterium]|mgnify:CR=1 FL=1|jgi:tol-pal system protein YbgF|nr:MAG: tol-pal system protein YbgF [Pseudomonadota bacterium]